MTTKSRKTTRTLPVEVPEEELLDLGREMAERLEDLREVEAEKKAAAADWKMQAERHQAAVDRLQPIVKTGTKFEEIECLEIFNWDTRKVEIVRMDSSERVSTREMTEIEFQMEFDGFDGEGA